MLNDILLYKITPENDAALAAVGIPVEKRYPEELIGNPYWILFIEAQEILNRITKEQKNKAL